MSLTLQLLLMLAIIFLAAELFTNALEHYGERLGLSDGVTGSLLAAMATAMPESTIPIVAIFGGTASVKTSTDIGVGAILGAPLMLATLTMFLTGLAVLSRRGWHGKLAPGGNGLARDLTFFLLGFGVACLGFALPTSYHLARVFLALALIGVYLGYVFRVFATNAQLNREGHGTRAHGPLHLCRVGLPDHVAVVVLQLGLGLGLLIFGAEGCVIAVTTAAAHWGVSALLLSLLLVPVATELPENINSVLWIRRGKDTLALGNISGAMVFQGCLLPALGILVTPWSPTPAILAGAAVTYASAGWLCWQARRGGVRIWHVGISGALYLGYVASLLM